MKKTDVKKVNQPKTKGGAPDPERSKRMVSDKDDVKIKKGRVTIL